MVASPSCPELKQLPWQWHLYNLSTDPQERHDLSAAHPAAYAQMRQALQAFAASVVRSQGPAENGCAANFGPPPAG